MEGYYTFRQTINKLSIPVEEFTENYNILLNAWIKEVESYWGKEPTRFDLPEMRGKTIIENAWQSVRIRMDEEFEKFLNRNEKEAKMLEKRLKYLKKEHAAILESKVEWLKLINFQSK